MNQKPVTETARQKFAKLGLLVGLVSFFGIVATDNPSGIPEEAWKVLAVLALMAVWWIAEAVPLAVTALLPVVLFPLLLSTSIEDVAVAYANPIIFLFLGGFLIASSMERWNLHSFVAQSLFRRRHDNPRFVIAGTMVATSFLSMWISNTAAALVMLPIGQSLVARWNRKRSKSGFGTDDVAPALMLGIAFSATIGGMATLIGTPPNALFAAFLRSRYGTEIGFAQWMLLGLPILLVLLPAVWVILTHVAFQVPSQTKLLSDPEAQEKMRKPTLSKPARTAAIIIGIGALALIFRPIIQTSIPSLPLTDAGILLFVALVLFSTPARGMRDGRLLAWEDAKTIRWDVLILVGGGLALASAIDNSGLSKWIGSSLGALDFLPVSMIILIAMIMVVYLGELASNTAMAAVFLPIAGAVAISMRLDPLTLLLPVALASSLGFMLPVATPPNSIVYGSGEVTNVQMIKAGAVIDIIAILVVYAIAITLGPYVVHR